MYNTENHAEGKSKMAIWIVSHCNAKSGRDEYVRRLQNYIPLDIYGKCGNLTCERGKQVVVVPIVMDLHGNYDRFVPPKSYINALDFPSVKELADYLKVLDKNDTLYNEYFHWKESYAMEYSLHQYELNIYEASARGYCELCSKLHDPSQPISILKDLKKWWNDDASCKMITFPSNNSTDSWSVKNYFP